MTIMVIQGPAKSGKTMLANAMRNNQISQRQGALLLDENNDGDPAALIEKLIDSEPLGDSKDLEKIKWKKSPLIVAVGQSGLAKLEEIEKHLPGFKKHHGPVLSISTGVAK